MIALFYLSIPLLLVYFLDHPTNLLVQKSFWLLYTFVITYLLVVWTLWQSEDWLDSLVKTISLGVLFYANEIVVQLISKVVATCPSTPLQAVFTQAVAVKTQEHQQQESAQRLSLLVKQTPLAVIEWTTDFEVVDWNPAAEKIFGYSKGQALGRHAVELIVPERAREQVNLVWRQLLQQKGGTRSTNENVTKEGQRIYCEWYNTPLVNAKGEVIGVASLVQDISERKFTEEALQQAKNELEIRVEARTQELKQALAELQNVVTQLQSEIDQRQRVEAALREREEQYRSVVDNVKEVIFQTDANGLWTFLNPAWSEITGFAIAKTLGTPLLDYVHPDDRQRHWEQFQPLIGCKKEYCCHAVRYITQDGGYRWIEVLAQLTFDADGTFLGTSGTLKDITQRHLSEAALRKSEERFRSLVANIAGVVYRCAYDADRTIEFISDAIAEISGYPAADFIHNHVRTAASLIAPQDVARVQQTLSECIAQRQPYVLQYPIVTSDGTLRWVYEKGQGVFSEEGSLLWLDGVIFDITDYKQTQENLRYSEEQFRQLTDNIREVFFLTTPNLQEILYVSPAYEKVWGRTRQSLYEQPRSWMDSIHPQDRDRVAGNCLRSLQKQQDFEQEYRIVRPDCSVRWVWVRGCLVFNEVGVATRLAGIAEDITERKRAEAEILNALAKEKELGDLKSRFVSITSHEFRTPLTTIMSTAELLEYYDWTKEEELEQLHLIQEAVKQMLQLLEDVLCIGTAEAGQLQLNPEPLALNEFCRELVAQVQKRMSLKSTPASPQHTLTFVSRGQRFLACMDKRLLRQVLNNLLANAIKYSPNGGTVRFELICQNDRAIFQIQDQGIGIPKEDQPRLFEFFHRAKNVGAITGTGLGLAIVKQCVDLHGGDITVKSEVGVGTLFTVTLPLKNHFSIAPYV